MLIDELEREMTLLNKTRAIEMGYSPDKRKHRRQHRRSAKKLLTSGGFFNGGSAPGSTMWWVAQWHLYQARYL